MTVPRSGNATKGPRRTVIAKDKKVNWLVYISIKEELAEGGPLH